MKACWPDWGWPESDCVGPFNGIVHPARPGIYMREINNRKYWCKWNGSYWCGGMLDFGTAKLTPWKSQFQNCPWWGLRPEAITKFLKGKWSSQK